MQNNIQEDEEYLLSRKWVRKLARHQLDNKPMFATAQVTGRLAKTISIFSNIIQENNMDYAFYRCMLDCYELAGDESEEHLNFNFLVSDAEGVLSTISVKYYTQERHLYYNGIKKNKGYFQDEKTVIKAMDMLVNDFIAILKLPFSQLNFMLSDNISFIRVLKDWVEGEENSYILYAVDDNIAYDLTVGGEGDIACRWDYLSKDNYSVYFNPTKRV